MTRKGIVLSKALVHLLCLVPLLLLLRRFQMDDLGADPVNTITHATGNWALYILLASLAVTPVRRLTPRLAVLIRFRRMIGLYAFFYATLHLATYVFLFSGYDLPGVLMALRSGHVTAVFAEWSRVWPTIYDDLLKRRFIQVGFASWVILLALAVTSPLLVLRAMGGKRWQWLHRTVYAAAVLGVIHFWWLVKPGVTTPWRVTVVLTVLLAARILHVAFRRSGPAGRSSAA
ncbi:MAG: sulfoxide reductase heme-binding subunit YedZ [Acidobacteriota bacterium]|nr:sulfoxide reductase heme-binding subunit YedZ [Acidobacteriota bacterium]